MTLDVERVDWHWTGGQRVFLRSTDEDSPVVVQIGPSGDETRFVYVAVGETDSVRENWWGFTLTRPELGQLLVELIGFYLGDGAEHAAIRAGARSVPPGDAVFVCGPEGIECPDSDDDDSEWDDEPPLTDDDLGDTVRFMYGNETDEPDRLRNKLVVPMLVSELDEMIAFRDDNDIVELHIPIS